MNGTEVEKVTKNKVVINDTGERFVEAIQCGIPAMVLLVDGIRFHGFKGDTNNYVKVIDAKDWFEKELAYGERNGYKEETLKSYREWIEMYDKILNADEIDGVLHFKTSGL